MIRVSKYFTTGKKPACLCLALEGGIVSFMMLFAKQISLNHKKGGKFSTNPFMQETHEGLSHTAVAQSDGWKGQR